MLPEDATIMGNIPQCQYLLKPNIYVIHSGLYVDRVNGPCSSWLMSYYVPQYTVFQYHRFRLAIEYIMKLLAS